MNCLVLLSTESCYFQQKNPIVVLKTQSSWSWSVLLNSFFGVGEKHHPSTCLQYLSTVRAFPLSPHQIHTFLGAFWFGTHLYPHPLLHGLHIKKDACPGYRDWPRNSQQHQLCSGICNSFVLFMVMTQTSNYPAWSIYFYKRCKSKSMGDLKISDGEPWS